MGMFINHSGKQYKYLKVLSHAKLVNGRHTWNCICSCGNKCIKRSDKLDQSCGCEQKKAASVIAKSRTKPNAQSAKHSLLLAYKKGAKDRDLCFSLKEDRFINLVTSNCYYCETPPSQVQKARGGNFLYNGIDRMDPTVGYTTANCVPCCKICNRAKLDMPVLEFQVYLARVKNANTIMKRFHLLRHEDIHGNSGIGVVAVGIQLPSGKCVMEWLSSEITDTIFENYEQIIRLHSHDGKTELIWGEPPDGYKKARKKKE